MIASVIVGETGHKRGDMVAVEADVARDCPTTGCRSAGQRRRRHDMAWHHV